MSFLPPIEQLARSTWMRAPQTPPLKPPPAQPNDPGLHLDASVKPGPNHFQLGIEGPDPDLALGGSEEQQNEQLAWTAALNLFAIESYATGHTPVTEHSPSDLEVAGILQLLDPNPPVGVDGADVTHAVYQSEIPNATAQEAYEHFINDPGQVFAAGGMEIRPPTGQLRDGGRYMLEIGTPVPTWLPVEITLDPANNAFTIHTLDGHVLRGEQTFTFTDDGRGGAVLTQDARFQTSSDLPAELQAFASIAEGQHNAWEHAHREIYEEFNGARDYKGIGTDFSVSNLIDAWKPALVELVTNPGGAVDTAFDIPGALANAGIDFVGKGIETAFNWLHVPGGGIVGQSFDKVGDAVDWTADHLGDAAEFVIDNTITRPVGAVWDFFGGIFGGGGGTEAIAPDTGTTTTSTTAPSDHTTSASPPAPEAAPEPPQQDSQPPTGTTTTTTDPG